MAKDMGEFLDRYCMIARHEAMKSIEEGALLVMRMLSMVIRTERLSTCRIALRIRLVIQLIKLILEIQMLALKESTMIF